jgi:glycosyltransferase involved in cell wall biosynthesis
MALYALPFAGRGGPRLVFDAHNAVWTIVERMRQNAPFFLQPLAAQEARRVQRYEAQIVEKFDLTLAVTEPDRLALSQGLESGGAERIHVVPIAVDAGKLPPVRRQPASANILTLGTLHYPPNADGIRWFLQEVFPLVRHQAPQATLTIIGKNPPADFLQAAEREPQTVQVTGYVPELRPYMEQAALVVVPVRAGGGMRVRILEAFALGMPVVTTTVGLEGIQAEPGRDVLVADTPAAFAAAVLRLLTEPGLAASLAANGRKLAEQRYDWQVVLSQMDQLYARLASSGDHE